MTHFQSSPPNVVEAAPMDLVVVHSHHLDKPAKLVHKLSGVFLDLCDAGEAWVGEGVLNHPVPGNEVVGETHLEVLGCSDHGKLILYLGVSFTALLATGKNSR